MLEKLKELSLAEPIAVVGMGASGRSALRFLQEAGYEVVGVDERVQTNVTTISLTDKKRLEQYATLVVSPGVDRRKAAIRHSQAKVINDIELFARLAEKPIAAVTGSNGKSTVVTMLAEVLQAQGLSVRLCGNIGRPVLEALFDAPEETDVYVLELSSYQLEICPSFHADVGAVLNVSPDHLDRYDSYQDYVAAKAHLAAASDVCILNGDDVACVEMAALAKQAIFYSMNGANRVEGEHIFISDSPVLSTAALSVHGMHNFFNALTTLLMAQALGVIPEKAAKALMLFRGLPHRMRLVSEENGVKWLDDSKATNIGATAAALSGITAPTWLIVGGVGKNQDFSELAKIILQSCVKRVLMIGVDNRDMQAAFDAEGVVYTVCGEMNHAVSLARKEALSGDWVLLSPATASFDQFNGYAERGECFAYEVTSSCR
ncbi:UDP-N-acetylmuramoyl-L-alanine--D-glutamate ligase [Suttonella ornithocola]|nr:UDP-N-acetylmuramoyl-L-alanine--D-glutamate ligase [Suttonella ornithocola]